MPAVNLPAVNLPAVDFLGESLGLLRVNGRLPRRAVLLEDGSLADRASHPEAREVDFLSRLCELCRQASGQPWHPRHTSDLLEAALATNSPGAWDAVRDDLATGDFDLRAAVGVFRHDRNPEAWVSCLVGARQERHFLSIACATARVLPELSAETRDDFGRALGCMLPGVAESIGRHAAVLPRDVADGVLTAMAKMVAASGVPDARVAELVAGALHHGRYDALRLFVHCPATYLRHRPQVLVQLLDRARGTKDPYPLVAMLARIAAESPDLLATQGEAIAAIAATALRAGTDDAVDARTCLAVAALVRSCPGFDPLTAALATALCACAARLAVS